MTIDALPRLNSETTRLVDAARNTVAPASVTLGLSALLAVLGFAGTVVGLTQDPVVTWGAIAANLLFWAGLAQGAVVFAASIHVAEARWGRLVERFALAAGAFLPLSVVAAATLWFGRTHLFAWHGVPGLSPWLNSGALVLRDAGALFVMTAASGLFARAALTANRVRPWAIAVTMLFFPLFGILSVDLGMTPDLRYHSTVYPLLYLSGCLVSGLGITAIAVAIRRRGALREILPPKRLLDLGNLVWGFALFVGYLWWCEFLVHWMGNIADEAGRHLHLWHDWPWHVLAWGALAFSVLVPGFVLFGRGIKKSAGALGLAGAIGMAGILLERLLDVLPALPVERRAGAALVVLAVTAGFGGLFGVCYALALRRIPLFPTEDPLFVEELATRDVSA